ncbi:SDR family NAD(P)-dependent oxidoreductase [Sorangium sp. So ce1000]|uniref:SDR family NAD(P)-dependent oxidoreductase n=1 Tax=Sorangium sp. So ce1000 TaxID=3133325 RepID=UPI003F5DBF3D
MHDAAHVTARMARQAELAELAAREGLALRAIELDVTSDASVDAAVARVLDEAGGVVVVANNAGILAQGPTEAFTVAQAEATFQVSYAPELWKPVIEAMNHEGPPDPQQVADAIRKLAELPTGERPLRVAQIRTSLVHKASRAPRHSANVKTEPGREAWLTRCAPTAEMKHRLHPSLRRAKRVIRQRCSADSATNGRSCGCGRVAQDELIFA